MGPGCLPKELWRLRLRIDPPLVEADPKAPRAETVGVRTTFELNHQADSFSFSVSTLRFGYLGFCRLGRSTKIPTDTGAGHHKRERLKGGWGRPGPKMRERLGLALVVFRVLGVDCYIYLRSFSEGKVCNFTRSTCAITTVIELKTSAYKKGT
jgi:hypothetical protein